MPRPLRCLTVVPGLPHHVVVRGNNRRNLFSYDGCYLRFLRLLHEASLRYRVPIHAVALMRNHVHLVVTPADAATLAAFVKHFSQRYAALRNQRKKGTGKVFEQRYPAFAIAEVTHLALTLAYVDLNPERAGLTSGGSEYRWSTYSLHVGGEVTAPAIEALWTPHDWYLGLGADGPRRAMRYREWVASRRGEELEAIAGDVDDRDDEATPYRVRVERPDGSDAK